MGFNTAVYIHNDLWNRLRDNPEKVLEEIDCQMVDHKRRDRAKGCGVLVMSSHHSNLTSLIAVGHNHFTVVHRTHYGHHNKEAQIKLLRDWAFEMGFDLHKRRKKKTD